MQVVEEALHLLWLRKLNLKAKFEGGSSDYNFNRLILGAFNSSLLESTCTALTCARYWVRAPPSASTAFTRWFHVDRPSLSEKTSCGWSLSQKSGLFHDWHDMTQYVPLCFTHGSPPPASHRPDVYGPHHIPGCVGLAHYQAAARTKLHHSQHVFTSSVKKTR
jgi:hypothetical protein